MTCLQPWLVPTRANGQPAFALDALDPATARHQAFGLLALALPGGRIAAVTRFDASVLRRFGLPLSTETR